MTQATKRYTIEFGLALAAYAVVLIVSITLLNTFPAGPWRVPVTLLPVVPLVFVMWAVMRALGRLDELQRRIQLEALGFGFAGTAFLTFTYGFLQNIGFPQVSWFFVWPVMAVLWLIGLAVASRKYR
jgi:hypothetical protein